MTPTADVKQYRDALTATDKQTFDSLIAIAYRVNPAFQNSVRWKAPTFTLGDNWHHWLFSITKTKGGIVLTFHKGALLRDEQGILEGSGKYMRKIVYKDVSGIDETAIAGLLREAIKHQIDMLPGTRARQKESK